MKVKLEFDLTAEEAKQTEFSMLLYDAYTKAVRDTVIDHIDPFGFANLKK
jgi:hypothetical protein